MQKRHKLLTVAVLILQFAFIFVVQRWFEDSQESGSYWIGLLLPVVGYVLVYYSAPMFAGLVPVLRVICIAPLAFFVSAFTAMLFSWFLLGVGVGHIR
jgi:hypothetical protein